MFNQFFSDGAAWFTIPALVGTAFFIFRLIMMMVGMEHGGDLHLDVDHGGDAHTDPSEAFKILSIQSIGAFLMGFGWGGIGALRGGQWDSLTSTFVGIACGIGMVWLLAMLLRALFSLQSSGNIALESTLGAEGDVYVGIPPRGEGRGQVRLVVDARQRIFNAVSDDQAVASQTRIRVTRINDDNTITVTPA